jgi:hypothetical protein
VAKPTVLLLMPQPACDAPAPPLVRIGGTTAPMPTLMASYTLLASTSLLKKAAMNLTHSARFSGPGSAVTLDRGTRTREGMN